MLIQMAISEMKAKMGKCPFHTKNLAFCLISQTNQGNILVWKLDFLKIEFQMYNSIFEISSYSERGLRIFFLGTQVPCKVLEFMELEFHLNFVKELEFHELEYFTWYSSSLYTELEFQIFFFYKFNFSVFYNSIVQKSSFKLKIYFQKIEF